jgi:FG-GAP repeat protein/VCBS repeat protein
LRRLRTSASLIPLFLTLVTAVRPADRKAPLSGAPLAGGPVLSASRAPDRAARIGDSGEETASRRALERNFRQLKDRGFWARSGGGLLLRGSDRAVEISAPSRQEVGWKLRLRLAGFGRQDSVAPLGPGRAGSKGNRFEIRREGVTEWYVSGEEGIEQGFSLFRPPPGREKGLPVLLEMTLARGGAAPVEGGRAILFRNSVGEPTLKYSRLRATDATGAEVPAEIVLDGFRMSIRIDDEDAIYPLQIVPLFTSPSAVLSGSAAGDRFGQWVAAAGDVDGDGYGDLLVGAPYHDNGDFRFGRAYLYRGGPSGIETAAAWVAEGDEIGYGFAGRLSGAGDTNGDGLDDIIVSGVGRALVYLGSPSGLPVSPDWSSDPAETAAGAGLAVAGAGDVNGDGFGDILIGSTGSSLGADAPGKVLLFVGSPSGPESSPSWSALGDQPGSAFGYAVAPAGDVDADGYDDVVIGEPGYDYPEPVDRLNAGKALVYRGSAAGLGSEPAWTSNLVNRFAFLGSAVSPAGDVNGDGHADVLIGGFNGFGGEQGVAQVYLGSPSGVASTPAWTAIGAHLLAHFGTCASGTGDVDGDGFDDVLVGEPDFDRSVDEESVGRGYLYRGSAQGPQSPTSLILDGESSFEMLGQAVAGAGDVNGDGLADVVLGAPTDGRGPGRAFVYAGVPANRAPVAHLASASRAECTSSAGAAVLLDGSASADPDSSPGTHDDIQSFEWFENYGGAEETSLGTGETIRAVLSLGVHAITLRVVDRGGAAALETSSVSIVDTQPPAATLRLSPSRLWPPNHRMVGIHAAVEAIDACGGTRALLMSVSSDEPDDAPGVGDGVTLGDIQGATLGTSDFDLQLRSERSETGDGRTYFIVYRISDASGNASLASAAVIVPVSRSGPNGEPSPPRPQR